MDQKPKSELAVLSDYLGAVGSVRKARSVFLTVVLLSLLFHIGAYCTGRWGHQVADWLGGLRQEGGLRSGPGSHPGSGPSTRETTPLAAKAPVKPRAATPKGPTASVPKGSAPARTAPTTKPVEKIIYEKQKRPRVADPLAEGILGEEYIAAAMPLAQFAGLAASVLLIMTYVIGVNVCLGGRMGGVCYATSALFWSIVLVALLFPWRRLVPGMTLELPDAFFDMEQLRRGLQDPLGSTLSSVLHYGRFLGCPILAFLAASVSSVRFGQACRQVKRAVEPLIAMKVV